MGMKRAVSPRRLDVIAGPAADGFLGEVLVDAEGKRYVRALSDRLNALLGGKGFVAPADSHFTPESLVILKPMPSDGGQARVEVKAPWAGGVVEVWRSTKR